MKHICICMNQRSWMFNFHKIYIRLHHHSLHCNLRRRKLGTNLEIFLPKIQLEFAVDSSKKREENLNIYWIVMYKHLWNSRLNYQKIWKGRIWNYNSCVCRYEYHQSLQYPCHAIAHITLVLHFHPPVVNLMSASLYFKFNCHCRCHSWEFDVGLNLLFPLLLIVFQR